MKVLVTGGCSNLGKAICKTFLDNGFDVIKTSRSGIDSIKLDFEDDFDVDSLVREAGEIDVLINNAGIFTEGMQQTISQSDFDKVFDVNVKGLFRITRALLPVLEKKNGSIVNISSINAIHPGFGMTAHYDASKAAVSAYTASLALETGLRINAVAPGLLHSARLEGSTLEKRWNEHSVKADMVDPDDVARAVFFLATSHGIYGQTIIVDNGYLLK